jgi:hypothetical protein
LHFACNYVNQIGFYGLGYGKDILVPFKEQARLWKKENATWSTFIWMKKQIG